MNDQMYGWMNEWILKLSDESDTSNINYAMYLSIIISMILYTLIAFIINKHIKYKKLIKSDTSLTDLTKKLFGKTFLEFLS